MSNRDEAKRLRVRDGERADHLVARPYLMDPGTPCLVAQTTKIYAYPTCAQVFFACSLVAVLGPEVEGGQAIFTTLSSNFFALNIGSTLPPQGTMVLVSFMSNRWVFRYDA